MIAGNYGNLGGCSKLLNEVFNKTSSPKTGAGLFTPKCGVVGRRNNQPMNMARDGTFS